MTTTSQDLTEIVNFGGELMPRGAMIRRVTATAKTIDPIGWQRLVNAFLASHSRNPGVR